MSLDLLDYEFMRLALVAAFFTGLAAPAIGTFMVQRRLALLGDGLGHVALTGVALGLLTGTAPVLTALVVAVLGAVVIEVLRTYTRTSGDVALAMLFYGGIAAGVLLIGLAGESGATLNRYLFGSITTVTDTDVVVVSVLGVVVVGLCLLLSPQLFAVCQDEEHAKVSGVPTRLYGLLIAVMAQVARSFRLTHLLAMAIGLLTAVLGVVTSFEANTAPGPTIVMLALGTFVLTTLLRGVTVGLRRRRSVRSS